MAIEILLAKPQIEKLIGPGRNRDYLNFLSLVCAAVAFARARQTKDQKDNCEAIKKSCGRMSECRRQMSEI
jgi:hypothetical protein